MSESVVEDLLSYLHQFRQFLRRIAPALGLALLTPLVGEYLLGNTSIVALPGGAMLTYAWVSFVLEPTQDVSETVDLIGNIVFTLAAILLLIVAARKVRRTQSTSTVIND